MFTPPGLTSDGVCFSTEQTSNIKQLLYHEQHQELKISSISLVFPSNPGPKILELPTLTMLLDQKEELSPKGLTPKN